MRRRGLILIILTVLIALAAGTVADSAADTDSLVYLPLVQPLVPETGLSVDPQSRELSRQFFHDVYLAAEGAEADWTGNHAQCDAGSTSQSFRDAVLLRLNYFRAMAGVPADLTFNDEYSAKAQQAALMMSANEQLSHAPPPNWECYTAGGDEAAGSSNLFLGVYGVAAIDGYMVDPGDGNYAVGHRRWILYPQTQQMGTGDIPPVSGHFPANALWVFDEHLWEPRPATREPYVAWPPPGYVPFHVVFPRWSFSYAQADFSGATVAMTRDGAPLDVDVRPVVDGLGENTLVWEPDATFDAPPAADTVYTVRVNDVTIDGETRHFSYEVVVFDPDAAMRRSAAPGRLGPPPTRR